ncbi:MAG: Asp-tRNA(Asn)/Glu-tRNA(Gln) amidotransferase subunit GatC, partial [Sphingopyxis sp.]|nr:Asp-tRNA(Asn)/Glu-tRNA(Gln) amidotransferase subunit GatC [Sphingopyxis sp.]
MAIDQATVRKIASLARIAISDAEAAAMEGELNGILGWVEQL